MLLESAELGFQAVNGVLRWGEKYLYVVIDLVSLIIYSREELFEIQNLLLFKNIK